MSEGLGRTYQDGELVFRQGDEGSCMYVIQTGRVEVVKEEGAVETRLGVLEEGEVFGDMAILEQEVRSATVRAQGEVRILTIDRRTFLRRVQEDPTIAFNVLRSMGRRVRRLDDQVVELRAQLASLERGGAGRPRDGAETQA
jgi:CRP-like cAMP-binding protein